MEFEGRTLLSLLAFLLNENLPLAWPQHVSHVSAGLGVMTEFPKCDGSGSVTYLGTNFRSISSHCNCIISTHYTGKLYFVSITCSGTITVVNRNQSIRLPCSGGEKTSKINVEDGDKLYMISTNVSNLMTESTILNRKIKVFAHSNEPKLFSVKCGVVLGGSTMRKTSHGTVNAVAAGGVLVTIVLTVLIIIYLRKRKRISSINAQYTGGIKADLYGDSRVEFPHNFNEDNVDNGGSSICGKVNIYVEPTEDPPDNRLYPPQHVNTDDGYSTCEIGNLWPRDDPPDNPVCHHYQDIADDGGYSAVDNIGFGNLWPREDLPDNPVYHPYQINADDGGYSTVESMGPKLELPDSHLNHSFQGDGNSTNVKENLGLPCTQEMLNRYQHNNPMNIKPYENAAVANFSINDPPENQNKTIYAQVNKPKKK